MAARIEKNHASVAMETVRNNRLDGMEEENFI